MTTKAVVRQKRPLVSGLIFLGIGIYLMMVFSEVIPSVEDSWPILLIIVGAALIARGLTKRRPIAV